MRERERERERKRERERGGGGGGTIMIRDFYCHQTPVSLLLH